MKFKSHIWPGAQENLCRRTERPASLLFLWTSPYFFTLDSTISTILSCPGRSVVKTLRFL